MAGILTELETPAGGGRYVVAGIGINVNTPPDRLPPTDRLPATSLLAETGAPQDRLALLHAVPDGIEAAYDTWAEHGFAPLLRPISRRSTTWPVATWCCSSATQPLGGAAGIDDDGGGSSCAARRQRAAPRRRRGRARRGPRVIDVFLTGTAPGVGKTRVAGLYAQEAIARGRTPGFLKPAQTGRTDDAWPSPRRLRAPSARRATATSRRSSPGIAARLEHAPAAEHRAPARGGGRAARHGTDGIIIEGGGLLEPLGEATTFADLAAAVGLPLVIVTRPDRAALSIVALTVEAAAARGIEVAGIAITGCASKPDLGGSHDASRAGPDRAGARLAAARAVAG